MISDMVRHVSLAAILILGLSITGSAQTSGAVVIDSDLRLFTLMTALNAAGFDVELGAQYHPVRVAARNLGKQLDAGLVERLRDFYKAQKRDQSDDAQLSKYISLAVSLTDAPEFKVPF